MDEQAYIDSGILYDYCTGSLTPQQMAEVDAVCARYPLVMEELQQLKNTISRPQHALPGPEVQEGIWSTLNNINKEKAGDLNDLPVINKYTDYHNWQRIVRPFMPATMPEERTTTVIRHTPDITQALVISRTDVDEEVHEHEQESLIILEGECECHIGNNIIRLGPGGFIEIPLYTAHNVRILSPYVVAIVQHVAV